LGRRSRLHDLAHDNFGLEVASKIKPSNRIGQDMTPDQGWSVALDQARDVGSDDFVKVEISILPDFQTLMGKN
jgi:hypothetical protein